MRIVVCAVIAPNTAHADTDLQLSKVARAVTSMREQNTGPGEAGEITAESVSTIMNPTIPMKSTR